MMQKKLRSLDVYEKAGAEMRLLKTVGTKAVCDVSRVLSSADADKLASALSKIDEICSKAEDNMFCDYPELTNEHLCVFYGGLNGKPINESDERVIEIARRLADGIFERERD